jgi:hypothetical protein
MSNNSELIVQQIQSQFDTLLARARNTGAQPQSAYSMEHDLFAGMLELGRLVLKYSYCLQQEALASVEVVNVGGKRLPLKGMRSRSVRSVFGKFTFERGYYYAEKQGYHLVDALLNLPEDSTTDLLREWESKLACYDPYHKTSKTLGNILGQQLSARAIEDGVAGDCDLATDFFTQQPAPEPSPDASILVFQADGKGIPMVGEKRDGKRVRLGKGEKTSRKKEAIATAVYTIAPCSRTPEEVTDSLFDTKPPVNQVASSDAQVAEKRKGPCNKWLRATLKGKSAAITLARTQVLTREGNHISARVALTDGAPSLQNQVVAKMPEFTLILDVIHAIEYLWKVANAVYGETSTKRVMWVRQRVLLMLSGNTQQIIDEFQRIANAPACRKRPKSVLLSTAGYFERNLAYMSYDAYLKNGWPIGTGVIEGACRHLIKDRFELSGMRWTVSGAESLLNLRSIAENDDWERFEAYRQKQRKLRVYGSIGPVDRCTTIERTVSEATKGELAAKAA